MVAITPFPILMASFLARLVNGFYPPVVFLKKRSFSFSIFLVTIRKEIFVHPKETKKGSVSVSGDLPENPVDRNDAPVAAFAAVVVIDVVVAIATAAVSVSAVVVAAAGDADNDVAQFSRK